MRKTSSKSSLLSQNTPSHLTLSVDAKGLPPNLLRRNPHSSRNGRNNPPRYHLPLVPDSAAVDAMFVRVHECEVDGERTLFGIDDAGDEDNESEDKRGR